MTRGEVFFSSSRRKNSRSERSPVLSRLAELRLKYAADQEAQRTLDREERAADIYGRHRQWSGSAFLIMQKTDQ